VAGLVVRKGRRQLAKGKEERGWGEERMTKWGGDEGSRGERSVDGRSVGCRTHTHRHFRYVAGTVLEQLLAYRKVISYSAVIFPDD